MARNKDKVTVKLVVVNAAVSLSPVARNKDKVTVKLINTVKLVVVNAAVSLSPVAHNEDSVRVQLAVAQPHHYLGSYGARGSR